MIVSCLSVGLTDQAADTKRSPICRSTRPEPQRPQRFRLHLGITARSS